MRLNRRVISVGMAAAAIGGGLLLPIVPVQAQSATGDGAIPLLRVGLEFPEPNLDQTKNIYASSITSLSLDTLLKFGPEGQLQPDLATSWDQPNPLTYVYHLRHGVKFWDGDPLAASDVAYSWNYSRAPGSKDAAFANVSVIKSVVAGGPYTVVVKLTKPDEAFEYMPAATASEVFEMKFAEEHKGTFGDPGTLVMGSGPWVVDSLDPTTGAELSANLHWWGGNVPIQWVSFSFSLPRRVPRSRSGPGRSTWTPTSEPRAAFPPLRV